MVSGSGEEASAQKVERYCDTSYSCWKRGANRRVPGEGAPLGGAVSIAVRSTSGRRLPSLQYSVGDSLRSAWTVVDVPGVIEIACER